MIVSGLPRSGTSMMMQMLEAGGVQPLTDRERVPDLDNPRGYYELERVKRLPDGDTEWLADAPRTAVKVVSPLLEHLPPEYPYLILFMRRNLSAVLDSQERMIERRAEQRAASREQLVSAYERHLRGVEAWMLENESVSVLDVHYERVVADPQMEASRVADFLPWDLDLARMAAIVDPNLQRQGSHTTRNFAE